MDEDTRSLWEIYDSEVEPWKKGRTILIAIGGFYFAAQLLTFALFTVGGNIDRAIVLALNAVVFWFVFYLIWIGVHWLRWVCGAWNMIVGFCLVIWAWRDENPVDGVFGAICLIVGVCFCLSSAVYFFARRQRENIRWKEAWLVAALCILLVVSLTVGLMGLRLVYQERAREASDFANEAVHQIFYERDLQWALSHVTTRSLQDQGEDRLRYFFRTIGSLGRIRQVTPAQSVVHIGLMLPNRLTTDAETVAHAETDVGWVDLYTRLFDNGQGWQIDRMWWRAGVAPENVATSE